jgi:hypothetical protein
MTTPAPAPLTAPSIALPGSIGGPSLPPLYVDGIPADFVSPPSISPGQATPAGQRFWSTQVRPHYDEHDETLIVSLSSPKLINYLSFDLPHFPHEFRLRWLDKNGDWQIVNGPNGNELLCFMSGSVPAIVNNPAALAAGLNPYHYGAGHWVHFDEQIQPITTSKLLFFGNRGVLNVQGVLPGSYPVSPQGKLAPYPLGLANLDFGYRARSKDDVPYAGRSPTVVTERESFTTSYDVNGNPVTLQMRENRASDLLNGLTWKCAPQPRSDCVVSLYADARDQNSDPQVIDRFYIQPVTSGCSLNLYYSPDPPPSGSGFQALDTPLVFPQVSPAGQSIPVPDAEGLVFANKPGWIDVSVKGTGSKTGEPWWTAIEFAPHYASSDTGSYMVLDAVSFQLSYQDGFWVVETADDGVLASWEFPFSLGDRLVFAFGYDGTQLCAWTPLAGMAALPAQSPVPSPAVFRFGAPQGAALNEADIWPGNYRLNEYIFKHEAPDFSAGVPAPWMSFAEGPSAYVAPPDGPGDTTMNALARFDVSFMLGSPPGGLNPYGFVGGPGSSYTLCTWTPVLRDFKLAAGYLLFNPVLASVFKFEFTSLQPQPFSFYEGVPQKAQMFPAPLVDVGQPNSDAALDAGLTVNQAVAPTITFSDTPLPPAQPAAGAALPTEALYATDADAADSMAATGGSLYNFQQWLPQQPSSVPVVKEKGQHFYQEIDVKQRSSVAYFVSVSALEMYRNDYTAAEDSEQYVDTFDDTQNIDPDSLIPSSPGPIVPWTWQPGLLQVPHGLISGSIAQVNSVVFNSAHTVRGIQLATTQSDPYQLLANQDFTLAQNGQPLFWSAAGDAVPLEITTSVQAALGNLVQVTRLPTQDTWSFLMSTFTSWDDIGTQALDWNDLEGQPEPSAFGGIAYSGAPVEVSAAGRLYAAARVFAPQQLAQPLLLQLLDGETGAVLAEAEQPVGGGVVTEWYVGYTIGAGGQASTLDWNQVTGDYPSWGSTFGQSWDTLDTSVAPLGTTITAQLIQQGITSDTWYADDISIFEDSIVWEFSGDGGNSWYPAYDIRNNPDGALLLPPPAQGPGTQLMWQLSGYREGLSVSSLAIRPWYGTHPAGVRPRPAGIGHGPNVNPLDHYPDIHDDPRWKMWDKPIPQAWFFAYKQLLLSGTITVPAPPPPAPAVLLILGDALVIPPVITPPPPTSPPTFSDIYADNYPNEYGIYDGSDVYTDNFGNDNYYTNYITQATGPTVVNADIAITGTASVSIGITAPVQANIAISANASVGINADDRTPPTRVGSTTLVAGYPPASDKVGAALLLDSYLDPAGSTTRYPLAVTKQNWYSLSLMGEGATTWPTTLSALQANQGELFSLATAYPNLVFQYALSPSRAAVLTGGSTLTAEKNALAAFLALLKSSCPAACYEIALWHESNDNGKQLFADSGGAGQPTYQQYWNAYAPVVKAAGMPVVPVFLLAVPNANLTNALSMLPDGNSACYPDRIYVDWYMAGGFTAGIGAGNPATYTGGINPDTMVSGQSIITRANAIDVPVGICEFGVTINAPNPDTSPVYGNPFTFPFWEAYVTYFINLFTGAGGTAGTQPVRVADICLYTGQTAGGANIVAPPSGGVPTDYKVTGLDLIFNTLSGRTTP